MSKSKAGGYSTALSPADLAQRIIAHLEETQTLREALPLHLDRHKFLYLARREVKAVLVAANGEITCER